MPNFEAEILKTEGYEENSICYRFVKGEVV